MSTLNENILKVKETFEDIAAAIEEQGVEVGECESPTTYAAKIRSITGTGDGLDPNKLYVEAYDAGLSEPTVEASVTDDGGVILTFGLRRGFDGAAGPAGPAGKDGKDGTDGTDGQDGADGMDGSVYEYVYFRGLTLNDKPANIPSGEGNNRDDYEPTYTKTVNVNGNSVVLRGTDKAQGVDETYKFEWRSERKKIDADTGGDFTTPVLGAKYGEKGKDGDGIQYIFKCTSEYKRPTDKITPDDYLTNTKYQGLESEEYVPTELGGSDDPVDVDATTPYCGVAVRKYRNDKGGAYSTPTLGAKYGKDGQGGDGTDGYRFEFIYKRVADDTVVVESPSNEQTDFYVPTLEGGTGNPQGVTDDLQVEYVSQREKIDGIGQDWSTPSVGAMYGKIGRDGNGVEYIYCLTSSETDIPTLPTMDSTKDESHHNFPLVVGKYSGSDDPQSVSITMPVCGVSTRKQHYLESGDQTGSSLSDPTVGAKYGKDGKEGGGRTVFIYTGSSVYEPSPKIATPKGGTGNVETNVLTGVTTSDNYTGTMNPPIKSETTKYIWQSVGSFNSSGSLIGQWSEPFCITGEDGKDGADGVSTEFIYRLISNKDNFNQLRNFLSTNKLENTATGVVPDTKDNIVDTQWTDEPSGIDGESYLIEAVSSRKAIESGGSEWSPITIGAMGGEDGNDGPGVEYIFRVTGPDMTADELYNEFIVNNVFEHKDYQKDEFYPGNEWGIDLDWTDEPQDIDENQPIEWVSIRKGIVDQETGAVVWGEFSKPKIGGRYAEDGYSYKTSYVFARSNEYPGDPRGGDYNHAYPTIDGSNNGARNTIWEDSVPEGDAIIGMTYRTFRSDNDLSVDNDGSTPAKMSDTANFQVEFTAEDLSKKSGYKPAKFTGDEDKGRAGEAAKGVVWADDVPGALYMATATCKNGVWNDWVVVKVKGEQGDRGADGTSVKIEGKFATVAELQSEGATYIANPSAYSNGKFILPLEQGDGYIVEEDGCLGVYDGNGTAFDEAGLNVGKIQGDSAMIYIRFSDNADGSGMYPEGTVGKYIGVATTSGEVDSNYLADYRNYRWAPGSGDDGFGYEQVFIATKTNSAPAIPSQSVKEVDGVPTNGSDKPISVSETNPFVGYVTRKTDGDGAGKGDKDKPGYAALYSRYSYDGEAFHLELTNDQGIIPLENGVIDPDFDISSVTTTMVLYAGDEIVDSGVSYKISNTNAAWISGNVVTLKAGASSVSEIECTATYNQVDYKKTFHIIKTANAFDIVTDKIVLERDPETGLLVESDKSLMVGPKRWNGQKGSIANGKTLFIKCYHVDGTEDFPESKFIKNSESVSLDLSDEINLSKVRLYFTEQNVENGTEICFEEIGVIANGQKGDSGDKGDKGDKGDTGGDGNGIVSIEKLFAVNNSPTNHPTSGGDAITSAITSNDNRYLGCKETTTYTNSDPQTIYYIVAVHGEPGASGTGNSAPIIYPAGVWDDEKAYKVEADRVPYVFYATDNKYYMLNHEYLFEAEGESEGKGSNAAPGKTYEDQPIGLPIDSFEAIYADIGLFNQALVGKWVFHGDYMFSQDGTGYKSGNTTKQTTYSVFTNPSTAISNGITGQYTSYVSGKDGFQPNFLVNAKTGAFYATKGVLSNSLLFKSGESASNSSTAYADLAKTAVNLAQKQQGVLKSSNSYGTTYPVDGTGSLPIAQVAILNLNKVAKLSGDNIKFVAGTSSGTLVLPSNTLFEGMTYNDSCYCPSEYKATKCSGGVDGTVTYITPWDNPGYDLKVRNYVDEDFSATGSNMSGGINDIVSISYSCPKVVIDYDSRNLTLQPTSKETGENAFLRFTAAQSTPNQYQCYVNVYFYFNELCVGRYCISGGYEIYDDSDTQ